MRTAKKPRHRVPPTTSQYLPEELEAMRSGMESRPERGRISDHPLFTRSLVMAHQQ